MEFKFRQIGYIESPFEDSNDTPIQPCFSDAFGSIIVFPEYQQGLKDLDGFSHIMLFYVFHRSEKTELEVTPYMTEAKKGLFATRSPKRPNKIGISIVQLVKIEENKLLVKGIDCLNKTPLLDIKPFVPFFDLVNIEDCKIGWLTEIIKEKEKSVY